jgi:anti-sigma B factor antagonist
MTTPANRLASVRQDDQDGVVVASVQGEIDVSNAAQLGHELTELSNHALGLVIDLRGVSYLDSAAIALFYDLHLRLERRAQVLVVVAPTSGTPRRVLEVTAFDTRAKLTNDIEAAVDAIRTACSGDRRPAQLEP